MYDMYRESTSVGLYETFQIANVVYGILLYFIVRCMVYGMVWYCTIPTGWYNIVVGISCLRMQFFFNELQYALYWG